MNATTADFAERVRRNQRKLGAELRPQYDCIVGGSGSSGSVVARRLAENPDASVLLLEAGGQDDVPAVMRADQWPADLGSGRGWNFVAQPNPHLNGRSIPYSMGKVLGGGSSINVMAWSRGHKNDWDYFASKAGDKSWSYESVLNIYRRIEDWHGAPDPDYRGTGGPVYVQPTSMFVTWCRPGMDPTRPFRLFTRAVVPPVHPSGRSSCPTGRNSSRPGMPPICSSSRASGTAGC